MILIPIIIGIVILVQIGIKIYTHHKLVELDGIGGKYKDDANEDTIYL